MINYSIIISHKNIPDLLSRCLDSIPKREDIQIIVVDDNSEDQYLDTLYALYLPDPNLYLQKKVRVPVLPVI